jgi:hypothetical protein
MSDKKKGDRLPTALIEANLDHIIKAGLAADHGHDQHDRLHVHGARGPPLDWLELERVIPLSEVSRLTSMSPDTIKRNHKGKLVCLSKRRIGVTIRNTLAIIRGE